MRIVDPPQSHIFESWDPYLDFFYRDHRGWVMPDTDKIKSLADDYDFVIVNCSTEHWGSQRDYPLAARLHDLLAEHYAKDFVCLCHDPADAGLRSRIMYYPFFAARVPNRLAYHQNTVNKSSRYYLVSNLNHIARDFRIANYLMLCKKSYRDQCFISFYNCVQPNHDYDGHFNLTENELQQWHGIKSSLSRNIDDDYAMLFAMDHPAFMDTYVHLVSETTIKDKIFLTEKTWQPVAAAQFFLIWGNAGIVTHLRDLGVDVFDDYIDHAYDLVSDHRQRLNMIHQQLDRLVQLDWQSIYQRTEARRRTNASNFFNGVFTRPYTDALRSVLPPGCL